VAGGWRCEVGRLSGGHGWLEGWCRLGDGVFAGVVEVWWVGVLVVAVGFFFLLC